MRSAKQESLYKTSGEWARGVELVRGQSLGAIVGIFVNLKQSTFQTASNHSLTIYLKRGGDNPTKLKNFSTHHLCCLASQPVKKFGKIT